MSMESLRLLPALQELPGGESAGRKSFRNIVTDLVNTDRTMYAAEGAAAASFGLWSIFDSINVDDNLTAAYEAAYPGLAADHSLYEHWQTIAERGPEAVEGFISGLKGKFAEFTAQGMLEEQGLTDVVISDNPTQQVWDISALTERGEEILFQVKTGAADYAGDVIAAMEKAPGVDFLVSSEIYDRIAERVPDLVDRLTDIGSDYLRVEDIADGLGTLADNMGLDIPDGIGDILPYAGAIMAGARLVYSVIKTEREFKAADRTTRNKIQVVQSLTVMSRMGVSAALATVGGMGGTAAGSFFPGVGNLVGGIAGTVAGAGMGIYLNKHLQPRMLNLALDITGLTHDDLFYYKNKGHIDQVALGFRETAEQLVGQRPLAALPAGAG